LKKIIISSWHDNPKRRPTFGDILEKLLDPAKTALKTQQLVGPLKNQRTYKRRFGASKRLFTAFIVFIFIVILAASVIIYLLINSKSIAGSSSSDPSATKSLSLTEALSAKSSVLILPTSLFTSSTQTFPSIPSPTPTTTIFYQNTTLLSYVYGLTIHEYDNLYVTVPRHFTMHWVIH
jgi:hypothetical protein